MPALNRRAIGIGAGAALSLAGMIGLPPALTQLHDGRDRGVLLAAIARHAPPPSAPLLAEGDALPAPTLDRARDALRLLLRDEAIRNGVLIERLGPGDADPAVASIDLVVSGPPGAVPRFAGAVESHVPVIRLARWRIRRVGAGVSVRLDAVAVEPWTTRG